MTDDELTRVEPTLRPMDRAEFDEWLPRNIAGYAEHIAASGAMPEAAAREKAARDTARSFSGGFETPGQFLFRVLAGDVAVGWLWLGVPGPDPLMAWVFQVEVAPEYRGRGYGRVAMLLAEDEARARGMASLGLNVHGQNKVARSLYDSLGYEAMSLQLKKSL